MVRCAYCYYHIPRFCLPHHCFVGVKKSQPQWHTQDLLRGTGLSELQAAMEVLLASPSSAAEPQPLFVACLDCGADGAAAQAAVRELVAATWAAAGKPLGLEAAALADYVDLHVTALPHRRHEAAAYSTQRTALEASMKASGAAVASSAEFAAAASDASTLLAVPSRADAVANAVCSAHLETAFGEFLEGLPDLTVELGGALDTFGEICDEAVDQALGTYDALAADVESDAASAKRKELKDRVLSELRPLHRAQVKQLEELAWDRMREGLVKLRLGDPSLLKDMEAAVQDADRFFRDAAKNMAPQGASWSADQERRETVAKMRTFVTDRLQAARLQGSYVPGMLRRPVAVSLHYLATRPFQILDALQDSLSYEEEMEWEPDPAMRPKSISSSKGPVVRSLKDLPAGVSEATASMGQRAER